MVATALLLAAVGGAPVSGRLPALQAVVALSSAAAPGGFAAAHQPAAAPCWGGGRKVYFEWKKIQAGCLFVK